MEERKPENQVNLFGEADMLYNTIHTELTIVNEDIDKLRKAIESKEKKIEKLEDRKENLEEAAKIAKARLKSAPGKKPNEESF